MHKPHDVSSFADMTQFDIGVPVRARPGEDVQFRHPLLLVASLRRRAGEYERERDRLALAIGDAAAIRDRRAAQQAAAQCRRWAEEISREYLIPIEIEDGIHPGGWLAQG
jgi:hypothetical protein